LQCAASSLTLRIGRERGRQVAGGGPLGPERAKGLGVDRAFSESSEEEVQDGVQSKRLKRATERCAKCWDQEANGSASRPSLLETKAVTPACAEQYRTFYAEFLDFCVAGDFDIKHALGMDFGLVAFFSDIFFEGWEPSKGEKSPGSSYGKSAKVQYGGRPDSAMDKARVGGLAEAFATKVAHSACYLRVVGSCGVAGQRGRARDGSFRPYGFWDLRPPWQPDGPSSVVAFGPPWPH